MKVGVVQFVVIVQQGDVGGIDRDHAPDVSQNFLNDAVKIQRAVQCPGRVAQGFGQFTLLAFGLFRAGGR